ncbi:MAG: ABC transporter ATP-binding protein [Planctomycetota bacterium]|nr:ABC transporter ATP-binding protein [Planctomycetota bacterium]
MGSFSRLIPYILPHRRLFILSGVFGLGVALLWGTNLSVAFPIVKVLLQGQSLQEYADQESGWYRDEIAVKNSELDSLPAESLKERARLQGKIADQTSRLRQLNWVRSQLLPHLPRDAFDTMALVLVLLLLGTLIKGAAIFVQDVLVGSAVEKSVRGVREACFEHCLSLDYQTLSAEGTAPLMSRFTNDINVMSNGLKLMGGKVVREPLKALTCVVLAFMVNWQLTLMSLLFVPLFGIVFYRYGKALKAASLRMMESMSRIYETLAESFRMLKVVIAFNGTNRQREKFRRENREYYHKAMQVVKVDSLTNPTTELLGLAAVCVALLPGAYLVLRGTRTIWDIRLTTEVMDVARLSLLYAFLAGTIDPIRKLSSVYSRLKRATAATDRIFELMDRVPTVVSPELPQQIEPCHRSIEYRNVSFRYDGQLEDAPEALSKVNLLVEAGEVLALVGGNGSGKSTLVHLLPRLFDPTEGSIRIDGIDVREANPIELRNQIGIVTQEPLLFDDTVFENIRFGQPQATREEIHDAAQQALVTEFVDQFPDGFETMVGEGGGRLSGGQRQRITLARAILRDPAILVLDEATSAIDASSEDKIHEVLRQFVRNRTVLMITHSLAPSVLELVTRVVVMDSGRIIATGRHEELLQSCPVYRQAFYSRIHVDADAA